MNYGCISDLIGWET